VIGLGPPPGVAALGQAGLARAGQETTIDGMRIPQLTGWIRAQEVAAAPPRILRGVFMQVGRLVMAADGVRSAARAAGATTPAGGAEAAGPVSPAAAAAARAVALPVPRYDELSLPSLRARLRGLDAGQVAMLADYERAHAARPDVVAMFERRIARLAAQ
jgi:hypothetical protein